MIDMTPLTIAEEEEMLFLASIQHLNRTTASGPTKVWSDEQQRWVETATVVFLKAAA